MDARVRYTKKMIRQEFLKLLEEKTLDQITVTAICQNAQINRATFYKYYENPMDLLKKLEQEQLDLLHEEILRNNAVYFLDTMRIVLQEMKKEQTFYQILFSENGDEDFRHRIYKICYNENMNVIQSYFPGIDQMHTQWIYYFIADGCNGVLQQWMNTGMQASADEIISFIQKMVDAINTMTV